jgi:hypothetical protein
MHTSSPHGTANLGKHLIAGNRLHSAGTHVIPAPNGLNQPSALNLVGFGGVKALNHTLGEQSSCGRGKLHRLVGDLIECKRHPLKIRQRCRMLK